MTTRARFVHPVLTAAAVAVLAGCTGAAPTPHGDAAGSVADGVQVEMSTVPPTTGCGSPAIGP